MHPNRQDIERNLRTLGIRVSSETLENLTMVEYMDAPLLPLFQRVCEEVRACPTC